MSKQSSNNFASFVTDMLTDVSAELSRKKLRSMRLALRNEHNVARRVAIIKKFKSQPCTIG